MTQEEKYKEALLEARAVLEPCLKYSKGKVREALDSIDKELKSFESEDEMIRKLLVWQVHRNIEDETNDLAQSVYDGIKGHDPDIEESIEDWKRCLAWLEKQKEQKPDIELIQRSWYMEGYHDRKFGKEPKWIIKTGEGGPKHELNPRYGQPLTEQQVTEEQLHNLNEAIKSFRMDGFDKIADSLHSLYNILNTQEQKPVDLSEMMVHKEPYIAPVPTPMVADEQKPDTRDVDDLQLLGFIYDLLNEIKWKDNWAMSKDECLRRLNNYRHRSPQGGAKVTL